MKSRLGRLRSGVLLLAALAAAGSCSVERDITGVTPDTPAPNVLLGSLLAPTGLLRCDPLPLSSSSKTIGPQGGYLQIGPHLLVVPPGALGAPVTIGGAIVPGPQNAVRFTPQGLQFDPETPAYLTMTYANCDLLGMLLPKRVAYTDDDLNILEYLLSWDLLRLKLVTGRVRHFSQYAVAW
jgi:hypothetical protein